MSLCGSLFLATGDGLGFGEDVESADAPEANEALPLTRPAISAQPKRWKDFTCAIPFAYDHEACAYVRLLQVWPWPRKLFVRDPDDRAFLLI